MSGDGPPVVLLHAGIADARMWEPQRDALEAAHLVVRLDARGFGRSAAAVAPYRPADDVIAVLDAAGIERAVLVGVSMGAMTAIDAALEHPARVSAVIAAGMGAAGLVAPSEAVRACWREAGELFEAGDLDGACEVEIRAWVDGPFRTPAEVDPAFRALAYEMNRALLAGATDDDHEVAIEPPAGERIGELACPLLTIAALLDQPFAVASSRALAAAVPGARLVEIPDAAHLMNMERPAAFNALVLEFLAGAAG